MFFQAKGNDFFSWFQKMEYNEWEWVYLMQTLNHNIYFFLFFSDTHSQKQIQIIQY